MTVIFFVSFVLTNLWLLLSVFQAVNITAYSLTIDRYHNQAPDDLDHHSPWPNPAAIVRKELKVRREKHDRKALDQIKKSEARKRMGSDEGLSRSLPRRHMAMWSERQLQPCQRVDSQDMLGETSLSRDVTTA